MTRFKHDLILRIIKIMDAVLVTVPFALCWYLYYAKHIASPFYAKGDYLVVALFFGIWMSAMPCISATRNNGSRSSATASKSYICLTIALIRQASALS